MSVFPQRDPPRMTLLRSRHTVALGTLLLGMLLVGSPVLEAFAGTCARQGLDAADASTATVRVDLSTAAYTSSAHFQGDCADAAATHVAAVSVDSPRWGVDADAGPSRIGEPPSKRPGRARAAVRPTAPDPVRPDTHRRSVVLQV